MALFYPQISNACHFFSVLKFSGENMVLIGLDLLHFNTSLSHHRAAIAKPRRKKPLDP